MSKTKRLIVLLCLAVSAGRFALDSYTPSLPAIAEYFGSTEAQAQLTATLYLLGFGGSQFIYGPLSDVFGRKKLLLAGFGIFIISGIMCTLSPSITLLNIARLFAGIGAGAGSTLSRAIVSDLYEGVAIAKAWAQITASLILSLMIAPVIGGYIQEMCGWRINFLAPTLYSLLVLCILFLFLPETNKTRNKISMNEIVAVYFSLLSRPQFIGYILCSTLSFAGLAIYFQLSSFIFINLMGLSPSLFGWLTFCIAIGYIISGTLVNRCAEQWGITRMLFVGVLLLMLGGLMMFIFHMLGIFNILVIVVPAFIYVLGARIVIPNATAGSLSYCKSTAGIVAALVGGLQMMGSSLISYIAIKIHCNHQLTLALILTINGVLSAVVLSTLISRSFFRKTPVTENISEL